MRRRDIQRGTALALSCAAAVCFAAEPVDVKGVALGASEAQLISVHPTAACSTPQNRTFADRMCGVQTSFAGAPSKIYYFLVKDQVGTVRVVFPINQLQNVIEALTSRFGQGERRPSDSRFMVMWRPSVDVRIIAGTTNNSAEGAVQYLTESFGLESERRKKGEASDRAKDL